MIHCRRRPRPETALGVGANTAIFSVVNAVMLRPLPYEEPDRLVTVERDFGAEGTRSAVSMTKFVFYREHNQVFDQLGAYDQLGAGQNLTGVGEPERIRGIRVSVELFDVLGVTPAIGRNFVPAEGVPGAAPAVIVSDGLWKRRFGADPNLIGQTITLGNKIHNVIGIMPPDFQFTPTSDVWTPLQPVTSSEDVANVIGLIGRMKPGLTLEGVHAGLEPLATQIRAEYPNLMLDGEMIAVHGYRDRLTQSFRPALLILTGAVAFVLLIACANVANLLLSRAASRNQEIAIRTALGAPRGRLIRQLLTEATLMSTAGAALGLTISFWGLKALTALGPANLPELWSIQMDVTVLLFTLGIALATGLLFGVIPALEVSRGTLGHTLQESGNRSTAGIRGRRLRGALVVAEVALSVVLLIGAALLLRSFSQLRDVEPGFDVSNVLTMQMSTSGGSYDTTAELDRFIKSALARIESTPGVEAAATITNLPTEQGADLPFEIGRKGEREGLFAEWRSISANYFEAMDIPLIRGRRFTDGETEASTPVVIINATLAKRYFPDQDPIGQLMTIGREMGPEYEEPARQIVGVVGDTREFGLDQDAPATMFVPAPQVGDQMTATVNSLLPLAWVVRTTGEPLQMASPVRDAIAAVDRSQPVSEVRSMEQVLSARMAGAQFNTLLLSIFAGVALFLAAIGIYGTMSYSVSQQTHELGLRMALGGAQREMLGLVVRQGMALASVGLAIGLAAAYALTRLMAGLLFGIGATDAGTFAAVALLLGLIALGRLLHPGPTGNKGRPDGGIAVRVNPN